MEVGDETWFFFFFDKRFGNTMLQITDAYHRNTKPTASGWMRNSCTGWRQGLFIMSLHCWVRTWATIHHDALVQCWHWLLLSNKSSVAFSAGAAIATYSVLDRFLSNWNSLTFSNRSFSLHFCLVEAYYNSSWFQPEHSDFHTNWSTYNLLTWKVFI